MLPTGGSYLPLRINSMPKAPLRHRGLSNDECCLAFRNEYFTAHIRMD
jgi:hypothetical protein